MKKRIHKVLVEPIKDVSSPIVEIEQTGQLSGFLLLNALFLTLLFANIPLSGTAYIQFWSSPLIPEVGYYFTRYYQQRVNDVVYVGNWSRFEKRVCLW
jgi:hypothetical protein